MKKITLILSVILSITLILNNWQIVCATQVTPSDSTTSVQAVTTQDESWPTPPEISAGSAILIDADTNTILYEKNSHIKAYPASITKLMTGLLAIENSSLTETVTFSREAVNSITWEDSQIPVVVGEEYTMEEALYALLLRSANEVAYGIAEHVAGSLSSFTQMMNQRAIELGALNTNFANASGLFDSNHYTSAYDIAMIAKGCMANQTMIGIMSSDRFVISPSNKYGYERTIVQRHEMLVKNSPYYYEYALGGKTGFTDQSKYTLATFARQNDMNLVCVVLLCENKEDRFIDTKTLFEYGFKNFEKLSLSSTDTSPLLNGINYLDTSIFSSDNVSFSLESSNVTVPKGTKSSQITMNINRSAATKDNFAAVEFTYNDKVVGTSNINISTTISKNANHDITNLPYATIDEGAPIELKSYIVINAWHIIYGVVAFFFLLIILLGLIFLNYSEYGKEMTKTRKRRKRLRRRKLNFK